MNNVILILLSSDALRTGDGRKYTVGKYCVFPEEFEAVALPIFEKVCIKLSDKSDNLKKNCVVRSVIY